MVARSSTQDRQSKMIAALLDPAHRSQESACAAVGVPRRTLSNWLLDPAFVLALRTAEGAAIDEVTRRFISVASGAGATMVSIMVDKANPPAVRLRAAQMVLDSLVRLRELRDVEERLTRLEAALGNQSD